MFLTLGLAKVFPGKLLCKESLKVNSRSDYFMRGCWVQIAGFEHFKVNPTHDFEDLETGAEVESRTRVGIRKWTYTPQPGSAHHLSSYLSELVCRQKERKTVWCHIKDDFKAVSSWNYNIVRNIFVSKMAQPCTDYTLLRNILIKKLI